MHHGWTNDVRRRAFIHFIQIVTTNSRPCNRNNPKTPSIPDRSIRAYFPARYEFQ